jgi:hypothetical protein
MHGPVPSSKNLPFEQKIHKQRLELMVKDLDSFFGGVGPNNDPMQAEADRGS